MSDFIAWIFSVCVQTMHHLSAWFGISYKEINALVFLVFQPSLLLLFAGLWIFELKKTAVLRAAYKNKESHLEKSN